MASFLPHMEYNNDFTHSEYYNDLIPTSLTANITMTSFLHHSEYNDDLIPTSQ